ncbi:MAG TPA: hypothetical protein VEL50_03560, partial [Gemmatimonadales bacterium]|nr:hypothetical protein [Gemmatimonadales bacterium]
DDDGSAWQASPQPLQLSETIEDGGVGWPDGVKQVASDHDQLGFLLQDVVNSPLENLGDIHLTLVRALGGLAIELPEAQVQVGEMSELHQYGSSEIGLSGGTA